MATIEQIREADARAKSAFFAGLTDRHPHGLSGLKWVIPPEEGRRPDGEEYFNLSDIAQRHWTRPDGTKLIGRPYRNANNA